MAEPDCADLGHRIDDRSERGGRRSPGAAGHGVVEDEALGPRVVIQGARDSIGDIQRVVRARTRADQLEHRQGGRFERRQRGVL